MARLRSDTRASDKHTCTAFKSGRGDMGIGFREAGEDAVSFRQLAATFSFLNLCILAALPLLHVSLTPYLGTLPLRLFVALGLGFLFHATVFIWVQTRPSGVTDRMARYLTIASIAVNSVITFVAATVSNQDSPYFALMIVPILEAAFRFSLPATLAVVALADSLSFYWVWTAYRVNPPPKFNEYVEVGTVSLIFTLVGVIVWLLVNRLRKGEIRLARNLSELEQTRKRLSEEEKLAAVGRLSSAIAHEIRNPVAMITSSLAMADESGLAEEARKEMVGIATSEARRLEKLTGDFLEYARPPAMEKADNSISDTILYAAGSCRAYALEAGVRIEVENALDLSIGMDASKIQQALLNLLKNAIEASATGKSVTLRGLRPEEGTVWLEVENAGPAIPEPACSHIFEPFFTTKRGGTGLGLAIARSIARAHGGDLTLRINEPERVCFRLELPATAKPYVQPREKTWVGS